jgi:hypothetical protein
MIKSVVANTAAGLPHPEDPTLRIQQITVVDPNGLPAAGGGSHAYGYDASDNLITDTWTIGDKVFVKNYIYTSGKLTSSTDWVKQ